MWIAIAIAIAASPEVPDDYWSARSDAELQRDLDLACRDAVRHERPVLLTFSASWCPDSRAVAALEQTPPLQEPLDDAWTQVVVDVGRFDRHDKLRTAFGVHSVVTYVALRPDCARDPMDWERIGTEVLEPTGDRSITAASIAAWLDATREKPMVPRTELGD